MNKKISVINNKVYQSCLIISFVIFSLFFCDFIGKKIVFFYIMNSEIKKLHHDLLARKEIITFPYLFIDNIPIVDIENYIRFTNDYSIFFIIGESCDKKYLVLLSNLIENPINEKISLLAESCINWIHNKDNILLDNPKIRTYNDYVIKLISQEQGGYKE